MAVIALVDPLLTAPGHGLTGTEFGPDHVVAVPERFTPAEVLDVVADADVVLTATAPVTATLLHAAPRVRLVAKPGAGVDNIDVSEATRRGVLVCNAPGVRGRAVAEYVGFALFYLAKRGWAAQDPDQPLPLDLAGRTLGLVGLGDIGGRVAALGAALGMEVVASTPSRRNRHPGTPVSFVDIDAIHTLVDVLVLCMPMTPDTAGLVRRATLEQMRPDAMLVNVARGPCVVTDDLSDVMRGGHLHGAALDVTDPEPLAPDHPLRALPNVLVTPHVAGRTAGAQRLALGVLVDTVTTFLAGGRPPYAVNGDALR